MFTHIETTLVTYIEEVPLEVFAFVASFIEEVIAPVPSAGVLLLTGTFAAIQGRELIGLLPLILIAALGKSIGAILVYRFSDYLSRLVFGRLGDSLKVSDEELRDFGAKITGTAKDYLVLTAFRALPIVPSSIVSVGCGMLKVPFRLFMITTVIGTVVRDSLFIYAGFTGIEFLRQLLNHSVGIESYLQLIILGLIGFGFGLIYWRRRRQS